MRFMLIRFSLGAAIAALSLPVFVAGQAPAKPRISMVKVLENDRLMVTRLTFPPGAHEEVHIAPQDLVVMQATPGDVEVTFDKETTTSRVETGKTWWISKVTPHAYSNVGQEPFDLIVVFLKDAK
jgi:quercetin dioxygenase-like cupin family protein